MSALAAVRSEGARSDRDAVDVLLGFVHTLRAAGVAAAADRVPVYLAAVDALDVTAPRPVYWAGRLTLCADPADLDRYDAAFALYFAGRDGLRHAAFEPPPIRRAAPFDGAPSDGQSSAADRPTYAVRASRTELLRQKDIAALSPAERDQLRRLLALLAPRVSGRRTRRYDRSRSGPIDRRRSIRQMLAAGGEPIALARHRRRTVPRRLVLLIDVSGSMAPYADALLHFAHAAVRCAPTRTEVFTIGTRLTRISRELRLRDPDQALAAAGRAVPDWSGGTRLGDVIKRFTDRWGQRGVARGAVVVLGSDGWERGDPATLGTQLDRLSRLAHSLVWVNPHQGKPGFAPVTGGMVAALPHLDALVAGHTLAAFERLARVIADA